MIVKETRNFEDIKKILCHPTIYDVINDDNCPPASEFTPPENAQYIAGYLEDIFALMVYHDGPLKCHIQVLPEYREHSQEFATKALTFQQGKTIFAEIPDCYPNVRRFAEMFGFEQCGVIESGYLKNRNRFDIAILRLDNGIC